MFRARISETQASATVDAKRRVQIVGLDLIRFAAAMYVVAVHLGWAAYLDRPGLLSRLAFLFAPGWIGVEIFFVLSGFVIAFSASRATPLRFVRSRIVRLFPAAWICSTISLFIVVVVGRFPLSYSLVQWLHSILLLPKSDWIDPVYWTLGIELVFYAVIFVHLLLRRYKAVGATFTVVGLCSSIFWINNLRHAGALAASGYDVAVRYPFCDMVLLEHGCFFSIGVLLWLILLQEPTPLRWLGLAVSAPGAVIEIWFHAAVVRSAFHVNGPAYTPWVPLAVWMAAVALVVFAVRWNARLQAALGDRGVSVARTLGLMSYPLYLLHERTGFILLYRLNRLLPPPAAAAIMVAASLGAAYAVSLKLEVPLQRGLSQLLHSRSRDRETPASSTP